MRSHRRPRICNLNANDCRVNSSLLDLGTSKPGFGGMNGRLVLRPSNICSKAMLIMALLVDWVIVELPQQKDTISTCWTARWILSNEKVSSDYVDAESRQARDDQIGPDLTPMRSYLSSEKLRFKNSQRVPPPRIVFQPLRLSQVTRLLQQMTTLRPPCQYRNI
jgi:hypothetical protein